MDDQERKAWAARMRQELARPQDYYLAPDRAIKVAQFKRKRSKQISLFPEMRQQHMLVTGLPSSGKSKFLEYMIRQDILAKHGGILIDPTGNLYNDLVRWMIEHGMLEQKNIVLFDPTLKDYAVGYNPLAITLDPEDNEITRQEKIGDLLDTVIRAFSSMMGDENAEGMPLYTRVLTAIMYVLAEQGLTLNEAQFLMTHKSQYREFLTEHSNNPIIKMYWDEINSLSSRDFAQWFMAPTNRIGRFLMLPTIKAMISRKSNAIDLREIMDGGKFVLVNLSKSQGFNQSDAELLGRLILNDIANKAAFRLRVGNQSPKPFYCYIDESYRYLNNDIAESLERLRQNGLRMILANQQNGQLREKGDRIYGAVTGAAQIKVYFRLHADDAEAVLPAVAANAVDYEQYKKNITSPTTVGHHREIMEGYSSSDSHGTGTSSTKGSGHSEGTGHSVSIPDLGFMMEGTPMVSDSNFNSESWAESIGESEFWSHTSGTTRQEALVPDLAWIPVKEYSLEEQKNKIRDKMISLENRNAVLLLPGKVFYEIYTNDLPGSSVRQERLDAANISYAEKHPEYYTSKAEVFADLAQREKDIQRLCGVNDQGDLIERDDEESPDFA